MPLAEWTRGPTQRSGTTHLLLHYLCAPTTPRKKPSASGGSGGSGDRRPAAEAEAEGAPTRRPARSEEMAALVRSSARRLAGSALLQRAPEGTQAVPAAGALLHQKNQHLDMDALRQPFLSRFMSTKRTAEYVLFEEARFSKLMKSVKSAKELDMNDVLMLESFKKLAHMRDRLPVKLSYWDSIILAAKARVIPTNTTHVRQRLHKFCLVFFAVLVVLSRCSTRSEWLGVGERFIRRKYPLVAAFFSWDDK